MDGVLIVDDNKLAVEIIEDLLKTWGYRTKVCSTSSEVFCCVRAFKPDAILLDIMLPGMNGFAICNKLKSAPQTSGIPVIILTVLNDMENRIHAFDMGADAFLTKPVKYEELRNRVEWAVRYKKTVERMESEDAVVQTLLSILQTVNPAAYRRSIRLSRLCESVGRTLYVIDEEMQRLKIGSALYDIGKIAAEDPNGEAEAGLKLLSALNMHLWLDPYLLCRQGRMTGESGAERSKISQMPLNLKILVTVNRFVELEEQSGDESSAISSLDCECKKGSWSVEVLEALRQMIRDTDYKKRIALRM